jgi:hypothetical protein
MSYLNQLRLHFAGRFQAAPSTVNNIFKNYDNNLSLPRKLLWNPRGDANWRLLDCQIRSAWQRGQEVVGSDRVLSLLVADSDRQVAAKLVDLDPQQQLVSQIWGLDIRLCDSNGAAVVRSRP